MASARSQIPSGPPDPEPDRKQLDEHKGNIDPFAPSKRQRISQAWKQNPVITDSWPIDELSITTPEKRVVRDVSVILPIVTVESLRTVRAGCKLRRHWSLPSGTEQSCPVIAVLEINEGGKPKRNSRYCHQRNANAPRFTARLHSFSHWNLRSLSPVRTGSDE